MHIPTGLYIVENVAETNTYNPNETRNALLNFAFREMYQHGFQAASLNKILKDADLTKGALYHHFGSKKKLGLSVIAEIIGVRINEVFMKPLEEAIDPITVLGEIFQKKADTLTTEEIRFGCPLNNLTQEMGPIDEDFKKSLQEITEKWLSAIEDAFKRGKKHGNVKKDVVSKGAALLIVATIEGAFGLGKTAQNNEYFMSCMMQLQNYAETLRP